MTPPNGCTVRRLASTSGRVAVIRTSTPARRTALAITFMSSVSTAEAATNTHSAPEAARMSERSSIDPRPGNPRSTPTSLVATTPMGRNPNAGLDMIESNRLASSFSPTISVGKARAPA